MTKVPTEFNGQIGYKEVGFLSSYSKDEDYYVYECKTDDTMINSKYILDFHSSVWILKDKTYQEFAQKFEVISGGWYGHDSGGKWVGGRWRALKRTFGEIQFQGIKKLVRKEPNDSFKKKFKIEKSSFSNKIKVIISSSEIGELTFECESISFKPSNKIALYSKAERKFVDYTNKLEDNGLKLIE